MDLQTQIDELKKEIEILNKKIEQVHLGYSAVESLNRMVFEDVKLKTSGATPIYTSYSYGGSGTYAWSSTNAPDSVLVVMVNGKRYWLPLFNPN